MKNLFFLLLMLCCAWTAGAVQVTVSGTVTDPSGTPQVNNLAIAYIEGDSNAYQIAYTDNDGQYLVVLETSITPTSVTVIAFDSCNFSYVSNSLLQFNPATGYSAVIDFVVQYCTQPNCWLDATYTNQANNTVDFMAYAFNADSNAVFTYTWDFGDGTTGTGANPSHTYAQQGFYNVTVTANSADCTNTMTFTVYVEDMVAVTVSGTVTTTSGLPVPGYPVDVYAGWVFAQGITDNNGVYSINMSTPASVSFVEVSVFDYCDPSTGGYSTVEAVINNGQATANFMFCDSFPQPAYCGNYFYANQTDLYEYAFEPYTYSVTNSDVVTYNWDFGDGNTSSEEAPTHTYTAPGLYNVLLTTVTEDSCEAHYCEMVFAFGDSIWCPIDTFYYGCQAMFWVDYTAFSNPVGGDPLTLDFVDASFGAVVAWEWNFGDGTTSTQGPNVTHTYAQEGEYTVTLSTTTADGCESTIEMVVYAGVFTWVEPDCQALFLPLPDSTGTGFFFLDMSIAPTPVQSWAWDFGDGTTSTEQNPFHVYAEPGIYEVKLIISADSCNSVFSGYIDTNNPFNGMANSSALGLSSTTSKTNEPTVISGLTAFPNPVKDALTVRFESEVTGDAAVSLRNSMGQLVRNSNVTVQKGANNVNVATTTLTPGIYFLQVNTQGSVQSVKIIKE